MNAPLMRRAQDERNQFIFVGYEIFLMNVISSKI